MADTELGLRAKLVAAASTRRRPPLVSLPDVDTAGLADGDTLVWDAASGKWKKGEPGGGGSSTGPAGTVQASDGAGGFAASSFYKHITAAIDQTQLTTLQSAPVSLGIPGPGAGKIAIPISGFLQIEAGTSTFYHIDGRNAFLTYTGDSFPIGTFQFSGSHYLTTLDDISVVLDGIGGQPTTGFDVTNAGFSLSAQADWGIWGPITSSSIPAGQGGSQYVVGDTGTVSGFPVRSSGDATYTISSVNPGGSGYAVGDTFTISGGTGDATGTVLTIGGLGPTGPVATFSHTNGTTYTTATNVATTNTSGSGTGLSLDITAAGGPISAAVLSVTGGAVTGYTLTSPGVSYTTLFGAGTTATTGIGTGLLLDLDISTPDTGTAQVDLFYAIVDAIP